MSADRHTLDIAVEDGSLWVVVNCPYDMTDETRPCWPFDLEVDGDETRQALPAPQNCNYVEWAENLSADEFLYGTLRVEVECDWKWDNDGPRVTLGAVVAKAKEAAASGEAPVSQQEKP